MYMCVYVHIYIYIHKHTQSASVLKEQVAAARADAAEAREQVDRCVVIVSSTLPARHKCTNAGLTTVTITNALYAHSNALPQSTHQRASTSS